MEGTYGRKYPAGILPDGYRITKTPFGFYQLDPIPTTKELEEFYRDQYYQDAAGGRDTYRDSYTDDEVEYRENELKKREKLIQMYNCTQEGNRQSFLDIGCGEGFSLTYFHERGFQVCGMDYSSYGIEKWNPDMMKYFIQGDIFELCERLSLQGKQYSVINLDNVLEHLRTPEKLLEICSRLLFPGGLLLINVPNDFNPLQEFMVKNKIIQRKKWIAFPDHISYFSREGLTKLCEKFSFIEDCVLGDQWIEFFALNKDTNYYDDPSKGPNCHSARMEMEKLLHEISLEKAIQLGMVLGDMGLGRELIGVYHKKRQATC